MPAGPVVRCCTRSGIWTWSLPPSGPMFMMRRIRPRGKEPPRPPARVLPPEYGPSAPGVMCPGAGRGYAQAMEAVRRPRPIVVLALAAAAIQLVGTHFAATRQPLAHPLDWFGVVLLLAGPALLLLHRRAPEVMLGGSLAVTAGYLALGYPWGPVPLSLGLALILSTAARRRAYAWSVAGA